MIAKPVCPSSFSHLKHNRLSSHPRPKPQYAQTSQSYFYRALGYSKFTHKTGYLNHNSAPCYPRIGDLMKLITQLVSLLITFLAA